MKIFVATLISVLTLVGGVNFYVDPGHRWERRLSDLGDAWPGDEVFVAPQNYDERTFRRQQLGFIKRPDVLVLGSSRGMLVDSRMFRSGVNVFNASMSNASIEDYIWVWERLKQLDKIPRHLLILIDPWVLQKDPNRYGWTVNQDLLANFQTDRSAGLQRVGRLARAHVDQARSVSAELTEMLSFRVFQVSAQSILDRSFTQDSKVEFRPSADFPNDHQGWRIDGSLIPYKSDIYPATDAQLAARFAEFTTSTHFHFAELMKWEPGEPQFGRLQLLLQDVTEHGTDVALIVMPYAPPVFKTMTTLSSYPALDAAMRGRLRDIATRFHGCASCNAMDPSQSACVEREFNDGQHALKPCVIKVLHQCEGEAPPWRELLATSEYRWF